MGAILIATNILMQPHGLLGIGLLIIIGGLAFTAALYITHRQTIVQAQRIVLSALPGARRS